MENSGHCENLWLPRVESSTLLLNLVPSDYFLFSLFRTLLWGKIFSRDEKLEDAVSAWY
jgi:hypothetical protein